MTGDGDGILRAAAAHELAVLMRRATDLDGAAGDVLDGRLGAAGADAGLIAVGARGDAVLRSNCGFMPRGVQRGGEAPRTALHD
jgi:isoaspartyl peptidase/L-asparaginase-like protein (Ntn-hydrolase superfamily)